MTNNQLRVAFVGLGAMGGAVARNLHRRGVDVTGYDPSPTARERCAEAGLAVVDAVDALPAADVCITSLPLPEVAEEMYVRDLALPGNSRDFRGAIDTSTNDPATARRIADACESAGIAFVAATLGKTPAQAEEGQAPVFAGGTPEALDELAPLLDLFGPVHRMGDVEQAVVFKLVSNLIGMSIVASTAEGVALAQAAGLDVEQTLGLLADTGADSFQLSVRAPMMARGDYSTKFGLDLAAKDLRLGIDAAARLGVPTPTVASALNSLLAVSRLGYGAEDVAAVHRLSHRDD